MITLELRPRLAAVALAAAGVAGVVFSTATVAAPTTLDEFVAAKLERANVPGLGVAAVRDGEVVWSRGFGLADVSASRAATADTPFMLASISKTFTATAAMQLVEDGVLDLDAPVSEVVGFPISNPRSPGTVITVRHLLGHASSIRDEPDFVDGSYRDDGDFPDPLGSVMRDYFTPGARYWSARGNFVKQRPGRRRHYSNMAYGLLGHVVEAAGGRSLEAHCQARIFGPLGMTETSWFLSEMDRSTLAMPTRHDRRRDRFVAYGHYGFADYPSGQLRTSARNTARFFGTLMRRGTSADGVTILEPETVELMKSRSFPRLGRAYYGLGILRARVGGLRLFGHDGGESGVNTYAYFRRDGSAGAVVLANGDASSVREDKALQAIVRRLIQEVEDGLNDD